MNAHRNFVGIPERKRLRREWEDNFKADLTEIRCEIMEASSGYGSLADSCQHANEISGSIEARNLLTR
jgi:hypothetical protein